MTIEAINMMFLGLLMAGTVIGSAGAMAILTKSVNKGIAKNPELKSKLNLYLYLGIGLAATAPLLWVILPLIVIFAGEGATAGASITSEAAAFIGVGGAIGAAFEAPLYAVIIKSAIEATSRNPEAEGAAKTNMFVGFGIAQVPGLLFVIMALLQVMG